MAYKCKTCGYKFKKGDSDLCPECFTARDDINCLDSEKHSHFKDFSESGKDDFISKQLKDEKKSGTDMENVYSAQTNNAYVNTQNTYQNYNSVNHGTIKSDYNGGKSTLRFTTSYNAYNNLPNSSGGVRTCSEGLPKNAKKIFIAFFVIVFFISALFPIAALLIEHNVRSGNYTSSYDYKNYNYVTKLVGYSDGDVIEATADEIELSSVYYSLEQATSDNEESMYIDISDENAVKESIWEKFACEIMLYNTDYLIDYAQIEGFDENGNSVYLCKPYSCINPQSYICPSAEFLICEDVDEYTITVSYVNQSDNSDFGTIEINFSYDDIEEISQN